MNAKTKFQTTLLTAFFFFALLTGLQAQDKYDYAMVTYKLMDKIVEVDINGEDYKRIQVTPPKNTHYLASPALQEVKKMNREGWELFDTELTSYSAGVVPIFVFYLRKKEG
jgi:hypothetical protein